MNRTLLLVLLVMLSAFLAGCTDSGGDDQDPVDDPNASTNDTNNTTAEPVAHAVAVKLSGLYPATIAYDPATITVPANSNITLTFTNNDQNPAVPHDWVLEGVDGAKTEIIENGQSDEINFMAPAVGEYKFYCSVQGHRSNGMEGDFVVQ